MGHVLHLVHVQINQQRSNDTGHDFKQTGHQYHPPRNITDIVLFKHGHFEGGKENKQHVQQRTSKFCHVKLPDLIIVGLIINIIFNQQGVKRQQEETTTNVNDRRGVKDKQPDGLPLIALQVFNHFV